MYCSRCGSPNDDTASHCASCGEVLRRPPTGGGVTDFLAPASAGVALTQGIVVTLFCCLPLGVVSIVYAALAMGQNSAGDYARAHDYVRMSNIFSWIGFGVGVVVLVLWVVFVVLVSLP